MLEKDKIDKERINRARGKKPLVALFILVMLTVFISMKTTTLERANNNPIPRVWQYSDLTNQEIKYSSVTKRILLYTSFFGDPWDDIPWEAPESFLSTLNCTISNCNVTSDKNLLEKSDLVLFHGRDMPNSAFLRQLRNKGSPQRQRWGYFILESPENTADPAPFHGLFNLTLTYRKDSDVWVPYSRYLPLTDGEDRPDIKKNYAANKKPGATWIVSHCGLLREKYVLKLQELYPVHVGGGCKGRYKNKLPCESKKEDCYKYIKEYKFYISFENGFCQEYITEKYWWNALRFESVPIVMGAGPYDNGKHGAIPGSYINVKDFKTIRDLANYLHYLDRNDTAYNEYFAWKQKYRINPLPFSRSILCPVCELIQRMNHSVKIADLNSFRGIVPSCSGYDNVVKEIIARS